MGDNEVWCRDGVRAGRRRGERRCAWWNVNVIVGEHDTLGGGGEHGLGGAWC